MAVNGQARAPKKVVVRRMWVVGNLVAYLSSVLVIAFVVNFFAHRDAFRLQRDATKTRAYSLSEQTLLLLDDLEGDWNIALVLVENEVEWAVLRQMDEILERFDDSSEHISVERIDPTNPASLGQYERLLRRLREAYATEIQVYDDAIDAGLAVFESLLAFARSESASLNEIARGIPVDAPTRGQLDQIRSWMTPMATEGARIPRFIEMALEVSDARPIPDYETARSTLVAALEEASEQLRRIRAILSTWRRLPTLTEAARRGAEQSSLRFQQMSQSLAAAADPLRRLSTLELSQIGLQLERGEAALVVGPDRAALIPTSQILPTANLRQGAEGVVSFDRRFRGEQIFAATIRAMREEHMPKVVFVHSVTESMLAPRPGRNDLTGVQATLTAAGFEVEEWEVSRTERPAAEPGQTIVWIVVPPPISERRTPQPSPEELALLNVASNLLAEGEPVLVTMYPSAMHRLRQPDLWQRLTRPFGIEIDTANVIMQTVVTEDGNRQIKIDQDLIEFDADHAIAEAVDGQLMRIGLPLPILIRSDAELNSVATVLAEVAGSPIRWLEADWATPGQITVPEVGETLADAVPIAVAAVRRLEGESTDQRLVVVGSADWIYSSRADLVVSIGGKRVALVSPGNIEFLQASVAWLADMDELIARSPASQQVARLEGLSPATRQRWGWILIAGMPLACLVLGIIVWFGRRI